MYRATLDKKDKGGAIAAVVADVKAAHPEVEAFFGAAFERTAAAGVPMVMDTCPAIEWRRRT